MKTKNVKLLFATKFTFLPTKHPVHFYGGKDGRIYFITHSHFDNKKRRKNYGGLIKKEVRCVIGEYSKQFSYNIETHSCSKNGKPIGFFNEFIDNEPGVNFKFIKTFQQDSIYVRKYLFCFMGIQERRRAFPPPRYAIEYLDKYVEKKIKRNEQRREQRKKQKRVKENEQNIQTEQTEPIEQINKFNKSLGIPSLFNPYS